MWIILVAIAALGLGVMGYRGVTADQNPALHQQSPAAAGHAAPVSVSG